MIYTKDHDNDLHKTFEVSEAENDHDIGIDDLVVTRPFLAARLIDGKFQQVSKRFIGTGTFWDNGKRSSNIKATFTDSFIIGVQEGKGCEFIGLATESPAIGRNSQYSPQVGFAVDPVSDKRPVDGGYPNVEYNGDPSKGGSTGILFDKCSTKNTCVGIIVSPNGRTQNGEMITVSNHRFGMHTYCFAGCQSQEKGNRIINSGCWSPVEYVFSFNQFGNRTGGQYYIDTFNVANAKKLVHRESGGGFNLHMRGITAESIMSIGEWYTNGIDSISESIFHFEYPDRFPDYHFKGQNVAFNNTRLRYYGKDIENSPLLMQGELCKFNNSPFNGLTGWYADKNMYIGIRPVVTVVDRKILIPTTSINEGDHVYFTTSNHGFAGMGVAETVGPKFTTISKVSLNIQSGKQYNILKYSYGNNIQ